MLQIVGSVVVFFYVVKMAYGTLRNEMKRDEMKICTLRNGKSVLCEMEKLYFAKWKICTLRNEKSVLCEMEKLYFAK